MLFNLIGVFIGGGLGSVCRYLFSQAAARWFGTSFSWGTVGVNLTGCLLIGFGFALAERSVISPTVRLWFMTGFLGGLTTFSTFALESGNFIMDGSWTSFAANFAANNLGGLLLVFVGLKIGELL